MGRWIEAFPWLGLVGEIMPVFSTGARLLREGLAGRAGGGRANRGHRAVAVRVLGQAGKILNGGLQLGEPEAVCIRIVLHSGAEFEQAG